MVCQWVPESCRSNRKSSTFLYFTWQTAKTNFSEACPSTPDWISELTFKCLSCMDTPRLGAFEHYTCTFSSSNPVPSSLKTQTLFAQSSAPSIILITHFCCRKTWGEFEQITMTTLLRRRALTVWSWRYNTRFPDRSGNSALSAWAQQSLAITAPARQSSQFASRNRSSPRIISVYILPSKNKGYCLRSMWAWSVTLCCGAYLC